MVDEGRGDEALADHVRAVLSAIGDPAGGGDVVATGRVESVLARDGLVQVTLRATRDERAAVEAVARAVERAAASVAGVRNATVVLTAHRAGAAPASGQAAGPAAGPGKGGRAKLLADVGAVVAVASGKGGVGKSTVSVNLAVGLARMGLRVGLLDADIHGPSVPRMLGIDGRPEVVGETMIPLQAFGVTCMSMGFLVSERQAMIWRGPMVMGALEQLMGQVRWPELDVMVVDMPPGTGDAQLTMAQRVDLAGAVIVSTPQDIALVDARRGIDMFGRTGVPILGLVENMSFFQCPHCGERTAIFGEGGVVREAERLGVTLLAQVPLLPSVRQAGDLGAPVAAETEAGLVFGALAQAVLKAIEGRRRAPGPALH